MNLPRPQNAAESIRSYAGELREDAARLGGRAAKILGPAAHLLDQAAQVYDTDPTIEGEHSQRQRPLDFIQELGRQIKPLVRQAAHGPGRVVPDVEQWCEDRWCEGEAMLGRLRDLLPEAQAQAVDTSTVEGSHRVSSIRLAKACGRIEELAREARSALAGALVLPHPVPAAVDLAQLAGQLAEAAKASLGDDV